MAAPQDPRSLWLSNPRSAQHSRHPLFARCLARSAAISERKGAALRELARVIRPEGELRFYEHVPSSRPRAAALQRGLDATGIWRRAMGGCHTARRTDSAIAASCALN